MQSNKQCEEYVNDEQTKKIFADWADYVAENKGALKKTYEIAKNMLNLNISKKDIAKATGLSMKEIKSLA